jgi:hypothetical protein
MATYQDILTIVRTVDDCLMTDQSGSCEINTSDSGMIISRQLQRGYLTILIGENHRAHCRYSHQKKNTASSTMAIGDSVAFNTESELVDVNRQLRSAIWDIIKLDIARQNN